MLTGLAAGVPGFIDYLYVVPPKSSAGRRATIHMLVNVSALVLMVIGMWFRDWDLFRPTWTTVLFELLSLVLVSIGGWLGGTLVYRNQIAVDHRYAHSGKWQEQEIEGSAGEMVPIDGAEHMKPGQMRLLHWGGRRLVLANQRGVLDHRGSLHAQGRTVIRRCARRPLCTVPVARLTIRRHRRQRHRRPRDGSNRRIFRRLHRRPAASKAARMSGHASRAPTTGYFSLRISKLPLLGLGPSAGEARSLRCQTRM